MKKSKKLKPEADFEDLRNTFENPILDPAPGERIVVSLQYWEGDRDKALRLARLLAGVERMKRDDVIFLIVHRRDATAPDPETLQILREKFGTVHVVKGVRPGEGHPDGCNALWVDTVTTLGMLAHHAKYAFTTEADVIPLRRDWINVLKAEAAEMEASGKIVSGFWTAQGHEDLNYRQWEHINGNMLVHTNISRKVHKIYYVPPGWAWDIWLSQFFKPFWKKGDWIYNGYTGAITDNPWESPNKRKPWTADEFLELQEKGYSLIHGVRGEEGFDFLKKMI